MDSAAGIVTTINDELVILAFSENILLSNSESIMTIAFPDDKINGWVLQFVFTDLIPPGIKPLSSKVTYEDSKIVFTYYCWYGVGIETAKPHYIESVNKQNRIYIILRTTAEKTTKSRNVQISIWKANN